MMKAVAKVRIISPLQVCRKHANWVPPTPPSSPTFGNPCLDLFFRLVEPNTPVKRQANLNYLNQFLPLAWSHNPLTTLKLICNLHYDPHGPGKEHAQGFNSAASWLHHNHPKTLVCNLPAIAAGFRSFEKVLVILYRILEGKDPHYSITLLTEAIEETEDKIAMAKKALDRYERDPHYRFLHDRVSDLFADCLKSDIENFKELKQKKSQSQSDDDDHNYCLELTRAARWCPHVDSLYDCTTLLSESIAKKIFPRISYQGFEENEADHADRARQLLMKEVLLPLEAPLEEQSGYQFEWRTNHRASCPDRKYLEEVKAGGKSKIEAGAMLPHKIIEYVYDCDELRHVAELQWKVMVEDVYLKQCKFRNCLAICDVSGNMMRVPMDVSVALGLLVSELNQEPAWKGKVITFNRNPQLLAIQGDDLRSKCAFVRRMDSQEWHCKVDFQKVFDLILEAAVNGNLRPEQMITKVFVFTIYFDFDEISANQWETDYEAIKSKFKEKGYGNVVPHLVVWNLSQDKSTQAVPCTQPGVTMLSGFITNNLVESFLDNDGDIFPDHVMEAALSPRKYQSLVVVD
ncbi:unnamed protein product [Prunus armeniaca]|uniref:Uncharacterized protein n=2 Tax=Prunus armeniaca TaxID=36596 RepID=A0A6J5ULP5_PRUAR|nr:unnamed protein product [Prunus armeniaca]